MGGTTRETKVGGHTVRITGREDPQRPFRGFFSGDELPGAHHPAEGAAEGAAAEEPPADLVVIEVDGVRYDAHRQPAGWFHLHRLPFQRFDTIDDAVKQIVDLIDKGVLRGGA